MQVAIPLYPRFTALDAVGPYTVMAFAPAFTVTFVAATPGPILDDQGTLSLTATATYTDLPTPDIVIVPGGPGTLDALTDRPLLDWLTEADHHTTWTTSVCSGSFILAAAGLLKNRKATTHWAFLDQLPTFGTTPVPARVVTDGKYVTAAGVSSGIDMALTLLAQATDVLTAESVQLAMEYDPDPPFNAGSPKTAAPAVRERALTLFA
ncbi:DJ-1/PfpI family protein [Sphaerisporangium aureirubrum]|uniref:DJ-1/PfpI family protein n=1 Tax=Sphaerisporangium aureirubrum TaxID=1544736 RepID=A0ABW1NU23_9ACTN